ncbi:MAG: hypothetical protein PHX83_12080 [Acidobacteriia bacterium]|nr:hypothetical protein [Terriglobia bacterium]
MVVKIRFKHPGGAVNPKEIVKEFVVGSIKHYHAVYNNRVEVPFQESSLARPQEPWEKIILDTDHIADELKRQGWWAFAVLEDVTDKDENHLNIFFNTIAFIENEDGKTIDRIVV